MATKTPLEVLLEKALTLNIDVPESADEKAIKELIATKEKEIAEAKKAEAEAKKNSCVYYWVKIKSFIDSVKTIEPGVYKTKEPVERLENSQKIYVEKFSNKIPDAKLYDIAKLYRVSVFEKDGESARPSAEILAELVKEL